MREIKSEANANELMSQSVPQNGIKYVYTHTRHEAETVVRDMKALGFNAYVVGFSGTTFEVRIWR